MSRKTDKVIYECPLGTTHMKSVMCLVDGCGICTILCVLCLSLEFLMKT